MDFWMYGVHISGIMLIAIILPLLYYLLRMMRSLKGGVAWKYIAVGFLFYIPRVTLSYFLDIYPSYSSTLEPIRFLLSAIIIFFIFMGVWLLRTNLGRVGIQLLKIPFMRYSIIGILIFMVGLLWRTASYFYLSLNIPSIWVIGRIVLLVGIVISVVCFRKVCWAVGPAAAAAAADGKEELLLRDDIKVVRAYTDLTSRFLVTVVSMIGVAPLKEMLSKTATEYDILRGCEVTDDGVLRSEILVENLKRVDEKDALPKLSNAFSAFNSRIIDLYSVATSPKLANETITRAYKDTKEDYKSLEFFPQIVKGMPEGVLEEEKTALLSREELEARVKERTAELEKAYKGLEKSTEERVKAEAAAAAAAAAADKARLEESEKAKKDIEEKYKKVEDFGSAMIYMLRDLSRTGKQLEEAKTYTENIMGSMADTFLVVNPDGKIRMANKALADILGYDEKEIIGKSVDKIFAPPRGGAAAAAAAAAAADTMFRGAGLERLMKEGFIKDAEMTYLTKDGKKIPMSFSGSVMRDEKGELAGIVCVAKDLSEIKKVVEELKTLDKMKSDFISIAAHELRTPLTPVRAYIEMIKAGKLGKTGWQQIEKLNIAEKNIDLLVRLIDDMLDVTRIEAGKLDMRKEKLSISEVVDIALDRVKLRMGEKRHRISIHVPPDPSPIYGDKELMVKVFDNLLGNAMKYMPGPGKIMVEVKEEGKKIHATVADTGIGIPKKDLEKIFERFYLIDSSLTRKHRGVGLGLAIAKGIVEGHNGKIWAESKGLGKGSTFHVVLPVMGKEK